MCSHEHTYCPRCNSSFECKAGNIAHCQCYGIRLTDKETAFIAGRYSGCLCAACMTALKTEYSMLQTQLQLKTFLQGR